MFFFFMKVLASCINPYMLKEEETKILDAPLQWDQQQNAVALFWPGTAPPARLKTEPAFSHSPLEGTQNLHRYK